MAGLFAAHGIRRGERVLIVLPDLPPPFAWTFFGVLTRAGRSWRWAIPTRRKRTCAYLVSYTRATAIVTVPEVAEKLDPSSRSTTAKCSPCSSCPTLRRAMIRKKPIPMAFGGKVIELAPALAGARGRGHEGASRRARHQNGSSPRAARRGTEGEHAASPGVISPSTHGGLREEDRGLSAERRHRERAAPLLRLRATGTNLMFPFAGRRDGGPLQRAPYAGEVSRTRWRCTSPRSSPTLPTMLGKLLEYDAELEGREASASPRSVEHPLLAFGRRGHFRGRFSHAGRRRFRRRVRRDRLGRDVPHLRVESSGRREESARSGKVVEGYDATRLFPGGRRRRRDAVRARRDRCALGQGRQRQSGVLARPRQVVPARSTATGAERATSSHGQAGCLYLQAVPTALLKVGGQWVAPLEVEVPCSEHRSVAAVAVGGIEEDGLTRDQGVRRSPRGPHGSSRTRRAASRARTNDACGIQVSARGGSSSRTCRRTIAARSTRKLFVRSTREQGLERGAFSREAHVRRGLRARGDGQGRGHRFGG